MQSAVRIGAFAVVLGAFTLCSPNLAQGSPLTPGVSQSAAQTANIAGFVLASNGKPVAGADVRLSGLTVRLATKTDKDGAFSFSNVPYGTYSIIVTSSTLGVVSRDGVVVKGDSSVDIEYAQAKTLARVTVVGSGGNINVTPANIYSVSPQAYAFAGNTSWQHLLESIPGVSLSGASFSGFGVSFEPGSPFEPAVISINGALPYETSTTLDGMPLENGSIGQSLSYGGSADLSVLSLTAFDAADVVRGPGANAPSIVDSIGGSFVLHAPGAVSANHYEMSLSNDQYGGVSLDSLFQLHLSDRFSTTIGYSAENSPGPQGNNAEILSSNFGVAPATINGRPFWGCGGVYAVFGPGACLILPPKGTPLYNAFCAKYFPCFNVGQTGLLFCCVPVDSSWTQHGYSTALTYKASPAVTAQVLYEGSTQSDRGGNTYYAGNDFEPSGPGYSGRLPTGVYFLNSASGVVNARNHQTNYLVEEKVTAFLGSGVVRLAALQNNTYYDYSFGPSEGPPPGQYTLFGTGYYCSDPSCSAQGQFAVFNGTPVTLTFPESVQLSKGWSENRDEVVSYAIQVGDHSSAGVSFVQSYFDSPNYTAALSFQGTDFCALVPAFCSGQDSSVSEATREVRLTGESQVSNKLAVDASWYFTRGIFHIPNPSNNPNVTPPIMYPDIDLNFPYNAPRLGLVWQSSPDLAIRGAAGGGFALPTLNSLTIAGNTPPDCSSGIYCVQSLNNPNLKPEKSFALDLGTDVRLHRETIISFDVYHTNLYGQFYVQFSQHPPCPTCGGLPLFISETENLAHTRYDGIDFNLRRDPARGLFWNAALGLTRSYVVSLPAGFYNSSPGTTCNFTTGANCSATNIIAGINFTGGAGGFGAIPYANGNAGFGYRFPGGQSLSISSTYIGPNNPYYVPAFVEFDALASYPTTKSTTVSVSVRNLTNVNGGGNTRLIPVMGAPNIVGPLSPLFPHPYGPRSVILTLNYKR